MTRIVITSLVLQFPAFLLGLDVEQVRLKLTSRRMESKWGTQNENIDVTLNVEQATYTRDAWTKVVYSRLFDYLGLFSETISYICIFVPVPHKKIMLYSDGV